MDLSDAVLGHVLHDGGERLRGCLSHRCDDDIRVVVPEPIEREKSEERVGEQEQSVRRELRVKETRVSD